MKDLPARNGAAMASAVQHTGSILVVEDNPDLRETLAELLEDEGYSVATAVDGVEALDYLHQRPLPGAIILDLMLPRLTGWELGQLLRENPSLAAIPVVIVSAALDVPPGVSHLGAAACFNKPFSAEELLKTVAQLMGNSA